ncbi:16S rRNA (cytosine967-C5)-methyltransferase [Thermotomaculum hydrothermale]|uniref:16S rRNA (Cytosine967-C5)-methyltransferase n=1 Tax=Thermotomaculum hydrothermale TaxID=981385 RepID=A0A7R6PG14_9BACT|nr:transcription antitermination factor NusB [Thermotomaculum hydrothermale]BBB33064.1 16S rRNA (cytosine967-C5)-methyltransferase [Thermotomaculum hydrothermale]
MNVRETAFAILKKIYIEKKLATEVYPSFLEKLEDERDKRLTLEIVYGVNRFKGRLEYVLSKFANKNRTEADIWLLMLTGVYQLLFLTRTPAYAVIHQTVEVAKKINPKVSGFVNAVLKSVSRSKNSISFPSKENLSDYIQYTLSFPLFLGMKWVADYGEEKALKIMKSLNLKKPVVFRCFKDVSPLKKDYIVHKTPYIEGSYHGNIPVFMIRAAECYIMNEASQLAPELLRNFKGRFALDAASSPGGKGFLLKSFGNFDEVVFNDVSVDRLEKILENSRELLLNVSAITMSDFTKPAFKENSVDAVILDAPCSGTGTISGHPEIKWIRTPQNLKSKTSVQKKMLKNAFDVVKKGGVVVYSVCSMEKEEGEAIVSDFVSSVENAKIFEPFEYSTENIRRSFSKFYKEGLGLRILPDKFLDGFFVAAIRKE